MYSNASEAYAAVRQYNLPMETAALAGTVTPNRYSYPLDEYSLNNRLAQSRCLRLFLHPPKWW